ncbi:MAG TPA: hypothetical protein PKL14_07205 [Holophaga sp.]|nr:hypothetical protein [Holophaga sp.]
MLMKRGSTSQKSVGFIVTLLPISKLVIVYFLDHPGLRRFHVWLFLDVGLCFYLLGFSLDTLGRKRLVQRSSFWGSHVGLFHQNRKELENAELTLKRTDLMLVHLQARRIHIDLIEVKNRRNASASALVALQDEIQKKNENTEKHFRLHFFSESYRLDAVIKNKELETILAFYFERALRYRLFDEEFGSKELREEFAKGLEAVAAGSCEVTFSHEGYIFNGEAYHKVKEDEVHGNLMVVFAPQGDSLCFLTATSYSSRHSHPKDPVDSMN